MSVGEGLFLAWSLGVFLVALLIAYRVFLRPTPRMQKALKPLLAFPGTAAVFIGFIILAWPISVPILYYQGYRDEKREAEEK